MEQDGKHTSKASVYNRATLRLNSHAYGYICVDALLYRVNVIILNVMAFIEKLKMSLSATLAPNE